MSSPIVEQSATVLCSHAGTATATAPYPRVTLSGSPVVTLSTSYVIAGCSLTGTTVPPCATGQWVVGASRVTAGGTPVAILSGSSVCTPTGTPLLPVVTQTRVLAT